MIACVSSSILTPVVALLVGLVAALIAFQQWRLAQHKLKYDLFDRRYKVFEATRVFLGSVLREAETKDEFLREFVIGTSDAEFLYPDEIVRYLDSLREHALEMRKHQKARDNLPVGDFRTQFVEKEHIELKWLNSELSNIRKVFLPYLGFGKIK